MLLGTFVDFLCQAERIHRMNHRNLVDDVFYFIGLQVSNQMPSYRLHMVKLVHDFLHFVFTDVCNAAVDGFIDFIHIMKLGHRNQQNIFARSSAACSSFGLQLIDMFYIFSDRHMRHSFFSASSDSGSSVSGRRIV